MLADPRPPRSIRVGMQHIGLCPVASMARHSNKPVSFDALRESVRQEACELNLLVTNCPKTFGERRAFDLTLSKGVWIRLLYTDFQCFANVAERDDHLIFL